MLSSRGGAYRPTIISPDVATRNNIKIIGRGTQPMLFAHGFGCDQNMWHYVAPAFEDDYRIVLFDYVGSGRSDLTAYDPARYSTLEGYSQDVVEIVDSLDLQDIVFVGHSVSSMIGLLASIARPDRFAQMILVGPSPRYVNDPPDYEGGFERKDLQGLLDLMDKNYIGWADFLAPAIMANPDQPEFAQELRDSFCSTDPNIARRFAEATFFADNRKDLPQVTVPSLILQCAEDIIAPVSVGNYLARELKNSTFVQMEATGHCPQISHPEETIRLIKRYLANPTPR